MERGDYPPEKVKAILGKETVAVLGYGVQGRGQSLNMKDNGVKVIVGQREKTQELGPAPSATAGFPARRCSRSKKPPSAARSFSICSPTPARKISGRSSSRISPPGKALYFSHGFSIVYNDQTGVDAAQGHRRDSGRAERLGHDGAAAVSGRQGHQLQFRRPPKRDRQGGGAGQALGIAIGSGYLFETTFQKEVFSDLTGERGVLMGAIYGLWLAQYEVLREHGHSPSEAFNETVEEATQSLYPLIAENGMDWMYANCSTTAQRGALDWFTRFRDAAKPVFEELYQKVAAGDETRARWSRTVAPIIGSSWRRN